MPYVLMCVDLILAGGAGYGVSTKPVRSRRVCPDFEKQPSRSGTRIHWPSPYALTT